MERLSSGKRINGAKDDAAGLSISTRMESQTRGYDQAIRNTNDGMSLLQTAEGALSEVTNILQRMRELSVQAASETYNTSDLGAIQDEVEQLTRELSRIAASTSFNGLSIFTQMRTKFQIQAGDQANQDIDLKLSSVRPETLSRQARANSEGTVIAETSLLGDDFGQGNGFDNFTLNGIDIRDSITVDDTVSTVAQHGSAIAKAKVINSYTEFTGVTAIVGETRTDNHDFRNNLLGGLDPFGNSSSVQAFELTANTYMTVNDVKLSGFKVDGNDATGSLVSAINAYAKDTGVIAHLNDEAQLVLVAEDGRNINIQYFGDNNGRDLESFVGLRDGDEGVLSYGGSLSLRSEEVIEADFGIDVSNNLGGMLDPFGFGGAVGVFGVSNEFALDKVNITDKDSAEEAIFTIDQAIDEVSAMRSDIGALHNRLEHTVSNLNQTSDNTKIAKSRIADADFAQETAELTKQMMAASGNVSVLAQANQSTSVALQLLGATGVSSGLSVGGGGPSSIF
jgi:flagellin